MTSIFWVFLCWPRVCPIRVPLVIRLNIQTQNRSIGLKVRPCGKYIGAYRAKSSSIYEAWCWQVQHIDRNTKDESRTNNYVVDMLVKPEEGSGLKKRKVDGHLNSNNLLSNRIMGMVRPVAHFKTLTGAVVGRDGAIKICLFVSMLKEPTFDWFSNLLAGEL